MSDSMAGQWMRDRFPPGQDRHDDQTTNTSQILTDIDKRIDQHNADMIIANNNMDGDAGVNAVLLALKNRDDKLKFLNLTK